MRNRVAPPQGTEFDWEAPFDGRLTAPSIVHMTDNKLSHRTCVSVCPHEKNQVNPREHHFVFENGTSGVLRVNKRAEFLGSGPESHLIHHPFLFARTEGRQKWELLSISLELGLCFRLRLLGGIKDRHLLVSPPRIPATESPNHASQSYEIRDCSNWRFNEEVEGSKRRFDVKETRLLSALVSRGGEVHWSFSLLTSPLHVDFKREKYLLPLARGNGNSHVDVREDGRGKTLRGNNQSHETCAMPGGHFPEGSPARGASSQ